MKTKIIYLVFVIFFFPLTLPAQAKIFKIASYNVENLYDLEFNGTEYPEYIPNTVFRWNKQNFTIKLRNISQVIKDLEADIVALQEIESKKELYMGF